MCEAIEEQEELDKVEQCQSYSTMGAELGTL
jgi:hypothetical protein